MTLLRTPSQTIGPFSSIGFDWLNGSATVVADGSMEFLTIEGRIHDGDSRPVTDAVLEFWQADSDGQYREGFTRIVANAEGRFQFLTPKPGSIVAVDGTHHAPHLLAMIFMRGLLKQLYTRLYFSDEALNARDPILNLVPSARRATLIARRSTSEPPTYGWDLVLQGAHETVFFDC
ncbi:MAG: protocatechuate 3,4-dioxygenase subunit alpha [Gammaproteobacteria bacterium]|nr:protocatechuate 3,4-dioxygenase subunit alpha [Gammaproteobacteria bacterium]